MENNRLGIKREPYPTVVLQNYMFFSEVGDKGVTDIELEVVGQTTEKDENGDDQIKYLVEVSSIKKKDMSEARIV